MGYSLVMELQLFIAGGIISLASLTGIFANQVFLKGFFTKYSRYLVSFATGIFAVLVYSLISEIFHDGVTTHTLITIAAGFLFFEGLTTILRGAHHHHGQIEAHSHTKIDARKMLLGDSLHNIGDGLLLVPLFMANVFVGSAAIIGILIHEIVQELAEFFVLKEAGYSTKKALLLNLATALTIFIGIGIGLFVSNIEGVAILLLAFTAGGFLHIILRDFIPSIVRSVRYECHPAPHFIFLIVGLLLMLFVSMFHGH